MGTNDPVVRYAAGAILVLAFLGALAVTIHGFWDNPNYALPAIVAGVLMSGVTTAGALLGVHLGAAGTQQTVQTTSSVTNTAATTAATGAVNAASAAASTAVALKEANGGPGAHS